MEAPPRRQRFAVPCLVIRRIDEVLSTAEPVLNRAPIGGTHNVDEREAVALVMCAGFFRAGAILATTFANKWEGET